MEKILLILFRHSASKNEMLKPLCSFAKTKQLIGAEKTTTVVVAVLNLQNFQIGTIQAAFLVCKCRQRRTELRVDSPSARASRCVDEGRGRDLTGFGERKNDFQSG